VHDLADYEAQGISSVMIASEAFKEAATHQAVALGIKGIAQHAVYVPHPIQDATDEEIRKKARLAFQNIIAALTVK
tara:strand:+ start:18913 stop:19140 length:228 start_codon:yes stop_codon:yes gene_type:complete